MIRRPALDLVLALLVALSTPFAAVADDASQNADSTVIYLVRHAEKVVDDDGESPKDPPLTDAGEARAAALAHALRDAGLDHVHSSDTRRTRDTAAPVAEAAGLEIELYDPRQLAAFADRLKATPGRHLVVGHSNTTPELAELLGGDGGPPIVEATEYDRLYVVVLGEAVSTSRLRFGAPSP